jgi:cellulose synthase operon protein C
MNMRILLVALVLMFAGCGLGMSAEQRVEKAREYLAADNYSAAIIELKNALQEDPVNLDARLLLADASMRAGDFDSASKEYQRAVDLGTDLDPIRLPFAETLIRIGNAPRALEVADPDKIPAEHRARVYWIRGLALIPEGQYRQAGEAFDIAATDPAMHHAAQLGRVRLAFAENDLETAGQLLEAQREAGAEDSEYWELVGFRQVRAGDPKGAAESLKLAIQHADDAFGGRRFILRASLAEAYLSDGNVEEARKIAERLHRDARQHPLPNYLMSRVEYQSGNYQQSLAFAQSLLSIQPGSPIGNMLAGAASLALGQPVQAEGYLGRAVEADPQNVAARKLLAQTRLGMDAPRDALAALQPVVGMDAEVTALAGAASMRAGDTESAIELFRRELAENPDNDEIRTQLAISLMVAGRNDEALAQMGMLKDLDDAGQLRADLITVALHLQSGDPAAAASAAEAAAARRPGDARIRNSFGAMYLAGQRLDEAQRWFEQALAAEPGNAVAQFNLGRLAGNAGRLDEAEAYFKGALQAEPGNVAAKTALAQLAWTSGRRMEAVRTLEELRAADPLAVPPRRLLAQYLQAGGERERALQVAREAAAASPRNVDAINTVGQMLLDSNQGEEALRAFDRALEIAPATPRLLQNRARAHAQLGDLDAARTELRNALAVDPEFVPARLALVDIERRTGRLDAAAEALHLAKEGSDPDDPAVAVIEGELMLARRDYPAAIAAFEIAVGAGVGGRAVVGLFQAKLQHGEEAPGRVLEDALVRNPEDTLVRLLAADHALSTGNHTVAIGHYEYLLRRQPDNPAMMNNLAWLYNRVGDPRAQAVAERALELQPDSPFIMDTLGWILHQKGDNRRALELIREAARIAPEVPEIRYHHAVLLAETGDAEGAAREARIVLGKPNAVQYHADAQALLQRLGR